MFDKTCMAKIFFKKNLVGSKKVRIFATAFEGKAKQIFLNSSVG